MGMFYLLAGLCGLTSPISNNGTSHLAASKLDINIHASNNGSIQVDPHELDTDSLVNNNGSSFMDSTKPEHEKHGNITRSGLLGSNSLDVDSHISINNGSSHVYSDRLDTNNYLNNNISSQVGFHKLNVDSSVNTTASNNVSDSHLNNTENAIVGSNQLSTGNEVNTGQSMHLDSSKVENDTYVSTNSSGIIVPNNVIKDSNVINGGNSQSGAIKLKTDTSTSPEHLQMQAAETAFKILGDISALAGEIFPEIEPMTTVLSAIFGFFSMLFGSQSDELQLLKQEMKLTKQEMKLMKHEFGEINMKLDTITKDLDLIKNLIVDTSLKSAYIADENSILNGFQKLGTFVDELNNMSCSSADDCARKRMKIEAMYLPYFDVSQNIDNIYRGAMDNTTVFSEPLLDHINKTYECDVPKVKLFTNGIIKLAFKEQQVTMVFNMLSGSTYSITNALNNWMKRMYKLDDYSKKITRYCLDNINIFMLRDIKAPKYQSAYNSNYEAAKAVRNDLIEKYSWLDWTVMAFDTYKNTTCHTVDIDGTFWSFPGVNKGRRNIIASFLDKGTFKTEVKGEVAEVLNDIVADLDDFDYFISQMKDRGIWKYIKSVTLLNKEQNWHYAKDSNHYERFFEQTYGSFRLFFTLKSEEERLFLKSDEERMSLVRCRLPCRNRDESCKQCQNDGACDHFPYSSDFFCDCKHYFHGPYCQIRSNITMATHLEEMFNHSMKIPKLTDVYFGIKDLSTYIGTSLGNIREALNNLGATVGKAFVQLHDSLSEQFRMVELVTTYGEQIKSLQYFIELFDDARCYSSAENDPGLHDLAEAVLGAQRYNGIRRWLHDFNNLINGTSGFTLTPEEPLLITYMDHFKSHACTHEYKDAIDNVWRQLMLLQQRGYMIWIQALHILNEPTDFAVSQYKAYTTSQIDTLKAKTCSINIPGSKTLNCSGGYYMNERIELTAACQTNYYLVGNATFTCSDVQVSCYFCNCSSDGALSQECDDQTGKCPCKSMNYGNKCENRDCVWSPWGAWSACPCGYANQTRNRNVSEPARGAGTCQGEYIQTRPCFQRCCSHQFHCNQSNECIAESQHCNNMQDCRHNEDERDCCETRHTPWYDNGGGSTWELYRHHIDCGSHMKMITKFNLEASPFPKQLIRYMYVCCKFSTQFCASMHLVNNTATEGNEKLIYLDKQHVDCGNNSVMNSFRLNKETYHNYYVSTGRWYYQYKCCDIKQAFQHSCQANNSSWTTEGSDKNFFLGRQDFQCQNNSYLSYFHLERNWPGHNLIRYNYRCCTVY